MESRLKALGGWLGCGEIKQKKKKELMNIDDNVEVAVGRGYNGVKWVWKNTIKI